MLFDERILREERTRGQWDLGIGGIWDRETGRFEILVAELTRYFG